MSMAHSSVRYLAFRKEFSACGLVFHFKGFSASRRFSRPPGHSQPQKARPKNTPTASHRPQNPQKNWAARPGQVSTGQFWQLTKGTTKGQRKAPYSAHSPKKQVDSASTALFIQNNTRMRT